MANGSRIVVVVGLLALVCGTAEAGGRGGKLDTSKGVLTAGGTFAFSIDHVNPDGGNSQTGVLLTFAPSFGGFVIKNLMIGGTMAVETGFGELYDGKLPQGSFGTLVGVETAIGFGFELQYLFNYGSRVVPYVGFGFGPKFLIPDRGDNLVALSFGFPGGILIALNEHVALNVGIRLGLDVGVSGPKGTKGTILRVPIGYLGVNCYF